MSSVPTLISADYQAISLMYLFFITLHVLVHFVRGDAKLCSQDAAVYTLAGTPGGLSRVMTSVQREINPDVFCIQSANCKCNTALHMHTCTNSGFVMMSWTLPNILTAACVRLH